MISLDGTNKLEALMGGAQATTNPTFYSSYGRTEDANLTFQDVANASGSLNGVTPVAVVAAPTTPIARHDVRDLTIFNVDTQANTITLQVDVAASKFKIWSGTIPAGGFARLENSSGRITVYDSSGVEVVAPTDAILDSDFAATEGFMRKTGAGTYVAHKSNLTAIVDPLPTDDGPTGGYSVGSLWVNLILDRVWVCVDVATPTLAVWKDITDTSVGSAAGIAFEVRKGSAGTIPKGEPVYISGFHVGSGVPEVEAAQANSDATMPAIGIANSPITSIANGEVLLWGKIEGVDTIAWSVGDDLYVSPATAGGLQNSRPTGATDKIQKIGEVLRVHATLGIIEIYGAGRTNAAPNLPENNLFVGDSNNHPQPASEVPVVALPMFQIIMHGRVFG